MDGFKISGFIIKKLCLKWYQINIRRFEKLRAKTRNKYFKKVSGASKNVDIFFTITKVFQHYSIFSITIKSDLTPSTEDCSKGNFVLLIQPLTISRKSSILARCLTWP